MPPIQKSCFVFFSFCHDYGWLILIRWEALNSLKEMAKLDILNLLCTESVRLFASFTVAMDTDSLKLK